MLDMTKELSGCDCSDPYGYRNQAQPLRRYAPYVDSDDEQPYYLREASHTPSVAPAVARAVPLSGALAGVQSGAKTPPSDTTAEGRAQALVQKWAEAQAKARTPEYASMSRAQGTDLPEALEAPMILNTMEEVDYYLDPNGWERCTINHWLIGTPSEDDLGFGSSIKKQFTAPVLEADPPQGCGDHSYGDQYADAFDALKSAGAPDTLIGLIRKRGQAKRDMKKGIFKEDAESNIKKGLADAANAANPLNPFGAIGKYVFAGLGAYLLFQYIKSRKS